MKRLAHKFLSVGLLVLAASSCATYVHPVGDWAEPVDLNLDSQSLEGVSIKLSCISSRTQGFIEQEDDTSTRPPCPYLAEILESAGATVYRVDDNKDSAGSNAPKPSIELNLQYKTIRQETDNCKFGYIPFIYTASLWPCRADTESYGAIVVYDTQVGTAREWRVGLQTHKYFGAGALVLKMLDVFKKPSPSEYHEQLKRNFITFVRNKVYTAKLARDKRGAR